MAEPLSSSEQSSSESRLRRALEQIANAEIPGVSGGPHGASAQVMEFAQAALAAAGEETPNVYRRFCDEVDALVIGADDSAVSVVGELTRAVKRAQMVVDGELAPVAERQRRS